MNSQYKSPLHETVSTTITDYWNDSCSIEELTYAIGHGAVGATSNPTIVLEVLKKEMHLWKERIEEMIGGNPAWSDVQVTWKLIEEMAVKGAELLLPIYKKESGRKGRLSIQTNPTYYRDVQAMTAQAVHFSHLAPNLQVKIPATQAGIQAIEDATAAGVSINATVSFTVPQALAVAEAVERGLKRRQAQGEDTAQMSPVCTLMIGRLDDWIQVLVKRDGIITDPAYPHWAGLACMKKAYGIYRQRGYRTRLLAAAYRHHLHWSELIGGDIVLTIPFAWQKQFNASAIEVVERMQNPVPEPIAEELIRSFPDFRRAYDEQGLAEPEFDTFGATVRTLRNFIGSYYDLVAVVREFMLPNPDIKPK
jgi:transaldolase